MEDHFEQIHVSIEDRVATVTLDRPDRHHALGRRIADELAHGLSRVEESDQVRVLIITSTGERAFCSGADLKERREMDTEGRWAHNRILNDFAHRLSRLQVPTIAAINGLALGGGLEIALACDLRIAAEHAEFALPEVGIGLVPGSGGTQRLPRLIGPARAKEMILTGRRVDAATAFQMGLLNKVVPMDDLMEEAYLLARASARNSPLAVSYAKAALDASMEASLEQGLRFEAAAVRATLTAEDYEIGLEAFARKRSPDFPPLKARRIT